VEPDRRAACHGVRDARTYPRRTQSSRLAGVTGTAGHYDGDYVREGEVLEQPGELLAVVDNDEKQIATIRVTAVDVVPFDKVSDEFARSEGEGFKGQADWAKAHQTFWNQGGLRVEADTSIVCLNFVIEPA